MAEDEEGVVADISSPSSGSGGDSASRELEGSPYADEDDGTPDVQPEIEGEEGEPKPEVEREPDARQLAQRLAEKEQQTHGLTRAVREARTRARIAEDRLYQVIERAMAVTAGGGATEGEGEYREPDPETDAAGAIMHKLGTLEERLAQQDEERLAEQEDRQVSNVISGVDEFLRGDSEVFVEHYPDYPEASRFVGERMRDGILGRLQFENPGADQDRLEAVAQRIFAEDLAKIHLEHARSRQSFAAATYQMARRMGWQGGGGSAPAPARRAASSPELEAHRRRLAGGRSLSQVSGSQPRRPPTKRDVVEMSDDQFDKLLESGVDWKTLAGSVAGE